MNQESSPPQGSSKPELKLYSPHAVMGFTVFFAPIFGGMLLRQNLIDAGNPRQANLVLLSTILYTLAILVVANDVASKSPALVFLMNLVWGVILIEGFYKRQLSGLEYSHKKIWKPLLISFAIILPMLMLMVSV